MVNKRQKNAKEDSNPSKPVFSKEQNDLKIQQVNEYSIHTTGQYTLNHWAIVAESVAPYYSINATDVAPISLQLSLHCHSTPIPWIVHGRRLKRLNQGNGFHRWLLGALVFLPRGFFDIVENSQGGNLLTLYYIIERL